MSRIDPKARFETLDFEAVEAGIVRGRRLRARAMTSAIKALFSRETKDQAEGLPDCAAA